MIAGISIVIIAVVVAVLAALYYYCIRKKTDDKTPFEKWRGVYDEKNATPLFVTAWMSSKKAKTEGTPSVVLPDGTTAPDGRTSSASASGKPKRGSVLLSFNDFFPPSKEDEFADEFRIDSPTPAPSMFSTFFGSRKSSATSDPTVTSTKNPANRSSNASSVNSRASSASGSAIHMEANPIMNNRKSGITELAPVVNDSPSSKAQFGRVEYQSNPLSAMNKTSSRSTLSNRFSNIEEGDITVNIEGDRNSSVEPTRSFKPFGSGNDESYERKSSVDRLSSVEREDGALSSPHSSSKSVMSNVHVERNPLADGRGLGGRGGRGSKRSGLL